MQYYKSVVFFVVFLGTGLTIGFEDQYGRGPAMEAARMPRSSIKTTFFPSLENYQVGATPVNGGSHPYPWVARVVHSPTKDYPHICTAICVNERIFVTAARCLYGLKVNYTRVLYLNYRYPIAAFVVPSEPSKQAFDDIGLLVVKTRGSVSHAWASIGLYDGPVRSDGEFEWFERLRLSEQPVQHRAVGYAVNKFVHRVKNPYTRYHLSSLDIVVGKNMCAEIFTLNRMFGFHAPCYHSCNLKQYKGKDPKCKRYLGVEGGAVINVKTNKLLGIATWGAYFYKHELPVGFAVPNSVNFRMDYDCAKKIRDDASFVYNVSGHYQALCNDMSLRVAITVTSLSLFVVSKNSIHANRVENMRVRDRMHKSNFGPYPDQYRK